MTLANTAQLDAPSVMLLENSQGSAPWPAGGGTVKANVGDTGYYRVLYDEPLAAALRKLAPTLPVADQLNLLSDTWALVENGRYAATAWLDLAAQFRGTHSQPVLTQILECLRDIDHLQENQPGRRAYRAWVAQFLQPQLARLGWSAPAGESALDTLLRARLIATIGSVGDPAVIAECQRRFADFVQKPSSLPGDLRGPVLEVVGRHADRETYDQLHALAGAAQTTEDKRRFYGAMQAALDPTLARETLALSLSGEMSITESTRNVAAVAASEHTALAWDFAREHMDALLKQMTSFGINGYLPHIMGSFTDAPRADELEEYVRKHSPPDAFAEAAKTADLIRHLADVKKRALPAIDAWVQKW